MLFNFSTFNHCPQGKIIVSDITQTMGHQLMALGHDVNHVEEPVFVDGDGVYNVVLESFADDPQTLLRIGAAHAGGCRFIIVATEEPTANGFNHGLEPAMIDRQRAFSAAARFADGILHLVPGERVTAWYSQHAPSAHAELGYAKTLVQDVGVAEPENDFGFYGKMTWRRNQMLSHLESVGAKIVRITSLDVPRETRDAIMRTAKVIVQIRANEEWGMVSSTRCATALFMGRPVVAEPHPFAEPWDRVIFFADTVDRFYRRAFQAARGWRDLHELQMRAFRERLTPEFCIGDPLRKIGILK